MPDLTRLDSDQQLPPAELLEHCRRTRPRHQAAMLLRKLIKAPSDDWRTPSLPNIQGKSFRAADELSVLGDCKLSSNTQSWCLSPAIGALGEAASATEVRQRTVHHGEMHFTRPIGQELSWPKGPRLPTVGPKLESGSSDSAGS